MQVSVQVEKLRGFCVGNSKSSAVNEHGKLTLQFFISVFGGFVSCNDGRALLASLLLKSKFRSVMRWQVATASTMLSGALEA